LQECAHPLHLTDREGERVYIYIYIERERDKEREREIKIKRERERKIKRERVRKRERKTEYLFFKGMTGALAPFSYLVLKYALTKDLKIVRFKLFTNFFLRYYEKILKIIMFCEHKFS
jgi:hypothetical protein